jgi:hypothetical protein
MKKNIFKTLAATVCFAALVLTGCVNDIEGTTPNYKQKAEQFTGNYGEKSSASGLSTYSFSFSPTSITTAAEDTEISVSFNSQYELDLDSVENAFTFYKLKENSKTKRYYPERDGVISKTLLHVTEPNSYSGTVSFLYRLNTKDVTTNKIAFVVDGTKLKYKNGIAAMSNDGNLKAGEETDSIIRYIDVSNKNDGTSTDTISNSYSESWTANNYGINSLSFYGELDTSETDTTPSGKYRFYCYAPTKTMDSDGLSSAYDDGLADLLAKKFKLQIQKPGSSKWEDGEALSFAYHSSYQFKDYDYYSSNTYTTDVNIKTFEQGTKWRIVRDNSVKLGAPSDWVKDAYGHAPFEYYPKVIARVYPTNTYYNFIPYADENTTYIFAWGNTGADPKPTFDKDYCDANSAFMTQNSFVSWMTTNEKNIEININTGMIELDKTDGFILVDSKKTIIPSTTSVHKNADGIIDKVIITPNNDKLNLWWDSYDVYVGSGTTIKENPDYPKQVQFGCYPDQSLGELSGYVCMAQNVIQTGSAFGTGTDAWDWTNGKVREVRIYEGNYRKWNDNEERYENNFASIDKVYLLKGETYKIQFATGYSLNSYRDSWFTHTADDNEICYYAQLYVFDADSGDPNTNSLSSYTARITYSGTIATINCSKSGYYYICVNRPDNYDADIMYPQSAAYDPRYDEDDPYYNEFPNLSYAQLTRDWYYDAYCLWNGNNYVETVENPDYDSEDDSHGDEYVDNVPVLFDYTIVDGVLTSSSIYAANHKTDTNGFWVMNPNPRVPYRWGNIYYHIYME